MKVIVFGATGKVGAMAVERMLAAGHEVTAFARRPEKLKIAHDTLRLHAGDAQKRSDVESAIREQDAVVVTLGSSSLTGKIRSQGTMNVIQGMQATGVTRLICQSTLGAHESWANLNFFWKRIMFGGLLRVVFKDHELQEMLVRASGLDWTIVRPSAFADGPAKGGFREGFGPELRGLKLKIPRADIAAFLERQLGDAKYVRRTVAISN